MTIWARFDAACKHVDTVLFGDDELPSGAVHYLLVVGITSTSLFVFLLACLYQAA